MIDVLSKPAGRIGADDIKALIESGVPEGEQIEFKSTLPAKWKGIDPWVGGKDDIGDRARNSILKETVAFANAYGGALLLGIEESSAKPPVATGIAPIPRCTDLAERLKLMFRDCVEPQLPALEICAVPTESDDRGVIMIRAGRSRLAPHRVTTTLVCPVRRSDRCEKMTMREIQDMTLNVSRGLERLERRLAERAERFPQEFQRLQTPDDAWGIRMTAAPVQDDLRIDRVFHQGTIAEEFDAPWREIGLRHDGKERLIDNAYFSGDFFPRYWRPGLRAARAESLSDFSAGSLLRHCFRELHCDGLVDLGIVTVSCFQTGSNSIQIPLPPDLPAEMFANLAVWADHMRKQANALTVEYALDVQILAVGSKVEVYDPKRRFVFYAPTFSSDLAAFPRYFLGHSASIPDLIARFYHDFWNSLERDVAGEEIVFTIQGWSG